MNTKKEIHPSVKRTKKCLMGFIGIPFLILDAALVFGLIDMFFHPPILSDYIIVIGAIVIVSLIVFSSITFGRNANPARDDFWELEDTTDDFLEYIRPAVITWGIVFAVLFSMTYIITPDVGFDIMTIIAGICVWSLFSIVFCGIPMAFGNRDACFDAAFMLSFGFYPLAVTLMIIFFVFSVLFYDFKILFMIARDLFRMHKYVK